MAKTLDLSGIGTYYRYPNPAVIAEIEESAGTPTTRLNLASIHPNDSKHLGEGNVELLMRYNKAFGKLRIGAPKE